MTNLLSSDTDSTVQRIIGLLGKHRNEDSSRWTAETTLEEVGVDSFDFIEFVFLLEDEFKIEIEYNHNDVGAHFNTVGDVAAAVEKFIAEKSAKESGTASKSEAA